MESKIELTPREDNIFDLGILTSIIDRLTVTKSEEAPIEYILDRNTRRILYNACETYHKQLLLGLSATPEPVREADAQVVGRRSDPSELPGGCPSADGGRCPCGHCTDEAADRYIPNCNCDPCETHRKHLNNQQ